MRYSPWVNTNGRQGWENNPLNIAAYRLWMQTDGRMWWQRHEWLYQDGRKEMDAWIDSATKGFPSHYIEVSDEDMRFD